MSECIFDDEWDEDLEEDLFPILMTRNEVLFLDDNMTMLVEREGAMNETVTTMRMLIPSAQLQSPLELIEKIGIAVLQVTDPEEDVNTAIVHLNTTEIYMLREICFSYSRVGREQVGYSLKRKFYQALFKEEYERDLKVNKLLKSVEAVKPEE